jgi:2-amino-4-hydroxy-6-hydroxymethyldihydropteridine diphosphokinase
MIRGYIGLGSNLGQRRPTLERAIDLLGRKGVLVVRSSRVYETVPVEVEGDQPNYYNMVVEFEYGGGAFDLHLACLEVEGDLGRERPYMHAPRTVDIDILLIDGVDIAGDGLVVPHPRMEQRQFVIHPLAEIAPGLVLPGGRRVEDVRDGLGEGDIVRILDR